CLSQPVAEAPLGLDEIRAKLLAKTADMDLDRVALDLRAEVVKLLLQLRLGKKLARTRKERVEKRPLAGSQLHSLPVAVHASACDVYVEVAVPDDRIGIT